MSTVYLVCTRENGPYSGDYFDEYEWIDEYEWTPTRAFWSKEAAEKLADSIGGFVCTERYQYSLLIRDHIATAVLGDVWIADGEGFAIIPTVDGNGTRILYCILFDLQRVKGLPFDLRMLVRTSYPLSETSYFATHGNIRFRHLVTLRMEGKMPPRNRDARRKRPQIK